MREGAAPRPLPERPPPADDARCAAGADGTFEEIDWDTAIAEVAARLRARCATSTAASRSSTTAAAGRGTTSAAPTAARPCAALGVALPLERARPGEDRRVLGQRQDARRPRRAATSSTPRSRSSSARTRGSRTASRAPASTLKEIAKDPERVADRASTRAAPRPPSSPTSTSQVRPGHRRVVPRRAGRRARPGGPASTARSLAEHADGLDEVESRARARSTSPTTPRRCGVDEDLRARRRPAHRRGARASRCSRTSASRWTLHSTLVSYLEKLLWLLTGNFAKPGAQYMPQPRGIAGASAATARRRRGAARSPARGSSPGSCPCNVIPDEILTDHPDRFRAMLVESAQPGALARRQQPHARGARRARPRRRDRRRDDRDRPPRRLRAAGAVAVREVGGDVLQLRVPAQRVPPAPAAPRRRCRARCPSRRSTPASSRRSARSTTTTSRRCGRPPREGRAAVRRGVLRGRRRPTRRSARWPRSSSTARSARRCPTAPRRPPSLWGAAHRCAHAVPRRRCAGPASRARASSWARRCSTRSSPARPGVVFTVDDYDGRWRRVAHRRRPRPPRDPRAARRARRARRRAPRRPTAEFPFVLSAGERRSFTANTIFRDPTWRKRDAGGALRVSPADAERARRSPTAAAPA